MMIVIVVYLLLEIIPWLWLMLFDGAHPHINHCVTNRLLIVLLFMLFELRSLTYKVEEVLRNSLQVYRIYLFPANKDLFLLAILHRHAKSLPVNSIRCQDPVCYLWVLETCEHYEHVSTMYMACTITAKSIKPTRAIQTHQVQNSSNSAL